MVRHLSNAPSVFVTGGSGAVGRHVIPALLAAQAKVRALVHHAVPQDLDCELVRGDILNFRMEWLDGIDAVIHLAARTIPGVSKHDAMRVNVEGTENMVRALEDCGRPVRLIFASSIAAFGPCRNEPLENMSPLAPITSYGESKVLGEKIVNRYKRSFVIRLPMVVGQGDRVTPRFEKMARWGFFPIAPSRFSAIDARDAARLFVHLVSEGPAGCGTFTVSDGKIYNWRDVASYYKALRKRRMWKIPVPSFVFQPWITRLLGNPDGAFYMKYDWCCLPNFPDGFEIRHPVFSKES